jgi:hypothetical protein
MSSRRGAWFRLLALAVAWVSPYLVAAQNAFSPGGDDYRIAGALPGDQTHPHLAINSTGGLLVWQDNDTDGDGLGIRALPLNGALLGAGDPFRVNGAGAGDQEKPQVALLKNGGAVVVWQGGRLGFQKIFARFLDAGGAFTTADIQVNTYTNEFQIDGSVACLEDGNVVVVWGSYGQDGSHQGVYGQRLSPAGEKLGAEFRVNQFAGNNQRNPSVAALAGGSFVVAWVSELQRSGSSVDIYARLFNAAGSPAGGEFAVNPTGAKLCANPAVAASPRDGGGGFAVVWSRRDGAFRVAAGQVTADARSQNGWDVFGRLYDAAGAPASAAVQLNTHSYGDQFSPRVSNFGRTFLTVWVSLGQDGSREGVFGQFLDGSGALAGVEFRVNTTTISRQFQPALAADGANQFLVAWPSFGAGTSFDLFARSYEIIRTGMTTTPQGLSLSWNTKPGLSYQVQSSTDFVHWTNLGSPRQATGLSDSLIMNNPGSARYYRVIRVP